MPGSALALGVGESTEGGLVPMLVLCLLQLTFKNRRFTKAKVAIQGEWDPGHNTAVGKNRLIHQSNQESQKAGTEGTLPHREGAGIATKHQAARLYTVGCSSRSKRAFWS